MNDYEFYHNWLVLGGLLGTVGAATTVYIYGKKKGVESLNWKVNSIIIVIFLFPTIILPILLSPVFSLLAKISITLGLTLFGAVRYFATTKGQEATQKLHDMKKELNEKQRKEKDEDKEKWF